MSRRLLVASDLHGSNTCLVKLVQLALEVGANGVAIAGDLTGKEGYVGYPTEGGFVFSDLFGQEIFVADERFESRKKEWLSRGVYVVVNETESVDVDSELERLKALRLEQWVEYLGRELSQRGIPVFVIPGNDDSPVIDEVLSGTTSVECVDGVIVETGAFRFGGLGVSNRTPFNTFRELDEDVIHSRLEELAERAGDIACSYLFHVPPAGVGLDIAPELAVDEAGELRIVPGTHQEVGSTAVLEFIQEYQPELVVSGHCHDAQGYKRIGKTFCVNPGSAYQMATLKASLLIVEEEGVTAYQSLVR